MAPSDPAPGCVATPPGLAARLVAPLAGSPRVLDPACGEGDLLLATLAARGGGPRALEGLLGLERDPERLGVARARLAEAAGAPREEVEARLRLGDALDPGTPWPGRCAVVANPPWVSLSGRSSRGVDPALRSGGRGPWGWPSLHGAFLARIAAHVADGGGRARLLLPASVCEQAGYGPVRAAVTGRCALARPPEELGEDAFPGVVEPAVLLELARTPSPAPSDAPWRLLRDEDAPLLARLAGLPRLPAGCFGDVGVHTGNSAAALLADAPGPAAPGIREGRDLAPYRLGPPRRGLRADLPRGPGRRFRVAPLARYEAWTVLLRQTADRPLAALHDAPTYFRNSLLAARAPEDLDPAFLVGVLNGPVATAWHRLSFADARQRTFPQVKVGHLRSQPFPFTRRADDPALHDEVARRVRAFEPAGREALEELVLRAFDLAPDEARRVRAVAAR